MVRTLETRIEALEQRQRARPRIVVINQRADGTWPPEPAHSEATLVIAVKRFGGAPDPTDSPAEVL